MGPFSVTYTICKVIAPVILTCSVFATPYVIRFMHAKGL